MKHIESSHFAATGIIACAALESAVKRGAKITEKRTTLPILANLHLVGTGEAIVITATDLDMWRKITVPGAVDSRFNVTAPAHTLAAILAKQKRENVTAKHSATITPPPAETPDVPATVDVTPLALDFGGPQFSLQTLSPADFPHVEEFEVKCAFDMATQDILDAFESVEFAISTEATRYYLNGIYMAVETWPEARLVFVATDGHRMARASLPYTDEMVNLPGVIFPRKAVAALLADLKTKGAPECVKIEVGEKKTRFTYGDTEFTTKNIDGTFPDYCRVMPTQNDKLALLNTKESIAAIEGVSVISSERGRGVRCTFDSDGVTFTVTNPDAGSAKHRLNLQLYTGEPLDIGLNSSYLISILKECRTDEIEVQIADNGSPVRFESKFGNARWTAVLMPMRV